MLATSFQEQACIAPLDTVQARHTRRVLLIEDDADQRRLIAWMLRGQGCDVVEAESGVDLLSWIGLATSSPRADYDAIVSDVHMPDMTAMEVLAGWRYGSWTTPLILVTASTDPKLRSEALALGVADVLTKPLHPADLGRALAKAIAGNGHPR